MMKKTIFNLTLSNILRENETMEITEYVKTALASFEQILELPTESLFNEQKEALSKLSDVTEEKIFNSLDAIHKQWIKNNLTPNLWVENFFNGQLYLYREFKSLQFNDVVRYYAFIKNYLEFAGKTVNLDDFEWKFEAFKIEHHKEDNREEIRKKVSDEHFSMETLKHVFAFKAKLESEETKNAQLLNSVNSFLKTVGIITENDINPQIADEAMELMCSFL